ncbi:MAG: hypothetical protein GTO24_09180 [candidate division Zixibacteria bacterium]|nr:hypothetical protein [candidate division Zixibacteria bacterium]
MAEEIQARENMNEEHRELYQKAAEAFQVLMDPSQRYANDWDKKWEDAKAIFGKIAEQNERLARYLKDTYEEIGYDISQLTPKIGNMHLRVFLQYASCYGWLEQVVASLSRFADTTKKPGERERS